MSDVKKDQIEYNRDDVFKILDTVNLWIQSADNKASILLAFIGVLITVVVTSSSFDNLCILINDIFLYGTLPHKLLCVIAGIVGVIGIISLIAVISPRIMRIPWPRRKTHLFQYDSFMFYGAISDKDYKTYEEQMHKVFGGNDQVINDLIFQIHSASVICTNKMENLQRSIVLLGISGFLIGVCLYIGKLC